MLHEHSDRLGAGHRSAQRARGRGRRRRQGLTGLSGELLLLVLFSHQSHQQLEYVLLLLRQALLSLLRTVGACAWSGQSRDTATGSCGLASKGARVTPWLRLLHTPFGLLGGSQ